jgi:tripartite-type tricarboxylate transporter receptor subunit TctC
LASRRALLGSLATAAIAPGLRAQTGEWPQDRVTIVTSLPAGSSVDITSRVFADKLAQLWGKPVVIDNRGGGNGVLACQMVARAKPDGLTLLATSAMTHAANPALYERLTYDPVGDFAAVTRFGNSPFVVMAHKGLGTTSLGALIERLRAEPGRHNYGEGSVPSRVASELFRMLTGVEFTHVGYRGNQAGFPDLLNGRISMMSVDIVGAKPLVDRGEVHALAVSYPERHPAVPDVPSCLEAGLPGLQFTTWSGLYAPRATPPAVVAKIQRDILAAFRMPDVRARLDQMGGSRELPATPEEFQAFTISEIASWGRIIRDAGLRLE